MAGLVPEFSYPENRPGICLNAPFVPPQVVFFLLTTALLVVSSPVSQKSSSPLPEIVLRDEADVPAAQQIQQDETIKTKVVGKMEDLEVAEFVFRPLFVYRRRQRPGRFR
ncbi:hypothetical protein RUM43_002407 [Polyplax serrata]|uniref:Uncharacterized protein n=1 Tax=Polyplax serrata TaxID=468196 RepID=A0AAN8PDU6_POLSC